MLTHRGFSAWIVSEGEILPEYLVAVDEQAHRVHCWIPSEDGKQFSVFWKDHGGGIDTCAFITLDGFVVPGRFLYGEGITSRDGVRSGPRTQRPFVFRKVDQELFPQDGEVSSLQNPAKDIGMITLRIKRVQRVKSQAANALLHLPTPTVGKRKAGDLCVGFGIEQQTWPQSPTTWKIKSYDADSKDGIKGNSYVSFVFRYRSREFLQAQEIIPVLPSAVRRPPARRIVSAPVYPVEGSEKPAPSNLVTPSPSPEFPPKKRRREQEGDKPDNPRPSPGPIERRRAVSCKVPIRNSKKQAFPGQGVIRFNAAPGIPEKRESPDDDGTVGSASNQS